jgi:hypothetical protein
MQRYFCYYAPTVPLLGSHETLHLQRKKEQTVSVGLGWYILEDVRYVEGYPVDRAVELTSFFIRNNVCFPFLFSNQSFRS